MQTTRMMDVVPIYSHSSPCLCNSDILREHVTLIVRRWIRDDGRLGVVEAQDRIRHSLAGSILRPSNLSSGSRCVRHAHIRIEVDDEGAEIILERNRERRVSRRSVGAYDERSRGTMGLVTSIEV